MKKLIFLFLFISTSGYSQTVSTVQRGGTNRSTLELNALLYGNGTGSVGMLSLGVNGKILGVSGGVLAWINPPATGVTSVGLSLPAEFTLTNTPITTAGTLTGVWAAQTTGKIFASPNGLTGVPSFRALVLADLPVMTANRLLGSGLLGTAVAEITLGTGLSFTGTTLNAATGGTVTSASVVSANGFAGTVATATTTPAITLSTTIIGILKGNGTAISAAVSGTDYSAGTSALTTGILKSTTITGALSIAIAADFPILNQSTTGSAATLTTPRSIYGNNFDGSTALAQIIASTFGGTGNGFTKFAGATISEKTYTLPNASATILTDNAAVTVAQGGTGQTTYTDGQLLIGNTTGNALAKATLTGTASQITVTNGSGSITLSIPTSPAFTTPVITGLATGSGVASAATASTLVARDANANISANNSLQGYTTTVTAAGITTLSVGSAYMQFFTGLTTQTITLPVASTLALGQEFLIVNNSTGAVTVNSSGANTVIILAASTSARIKCILISGITAASWDASYSGANVAAGKVATINNSLTLAGTDATTMTFPTTSATIARTDAANTFTGVQTFNTAIAATSGGTAQSTYTTGDLLYASASNTLSKLAIGTSTQVLTVTGGVPVWAAAGGGGMSIGGSITSATAKSVLYAGAAGVLAQDNANFAWDYTNHRLGLGLATPAYLLDVLGAADVTAANIVASSTGSTVVRALLLAPTAGGSGNVYGADITSTSNGNGIAYGIAITTVKNGATSPIPLTINGKFQVAHDGTVTLGSAGATLGGLKFSGNTSGTITMQSAAAAGTWSLTLPTSAGSASQFLQTDGSGVTTWATPSATLSNWTESVNTAAPNATVPAVRFLATNAATNVDAVISPKGTGALLAQSPDNASTGGNKRGTYAVDWQMIRNTNTMVASGIKSVIGGGERNLANNDYATIAGGFNGTASGINSFIGGGDVNTASGNWSTCSGGESNTASNSASTVGGGWINTASGLYSTVPGGFTNTASGDYSISMGKYAKADKYGQFTLATGRFAATGDAQSSMFVVFKNTIDATANVELLLGGVNSITMPTNSAWIFTGTVIGKTSATANYSCWTIRGSAVNNGGVITVNGITLVLVNDGLTLVATPPNVQAIAGSGIKVVVTGAAATSINWVAQLVTAEVLF